MHLRMDGLEPRDDLVEAVRREPERVDAGWAPFWHYQRLGMYGRQLADLYDHFPREQVLLLRYKELVDQPQRTLDRVCVFLGVTSPPSASVPRDNSRKFVHPSPRTRAIGSVIRTGAKAGQFFPPEVWRRVSRPLVEQLQRRGDDARPRLTPEQRATLLAPHLPDIELLETLTGESFAEWKGYRDGGTFESRRVALDA
jgi:hypothetical protein